MKEIEQYLFSAQIVSSKRTHGACVVVIRKLPSVLVKLINIIRASQNREERTQEGGEGEEGEIKKKKVRCTWGSFFRSPRTHHSSGVGETSSLCRTTSSACKQNNKTSINNNNITEK